VGELLPRRIVDRASARRLEATAILQPGTAPLEAYRSSVEAGTAEFAEWDGRVLILQPDDEPAHRLLVVDRYRQVYAVHDAADAAELPDVHALSEWFRFLATACPECGVLDEAVMGGPTP
jgi:hypothetical protein